MGIITEISTQKNKKRVNIFVDGEFIAAMSFETAAKHMLKTGKEISIKELNDIVLESETHLAFTAGLDYLAVSVKSGYEIKQKLIKKGYNEQAVLLAIDKLKDYGYINDSAYALTFIKQNNKKSKREIEQKLRLKVFQRQQ